MDFLQKLDDLMAKNALNRRSLSQKSGIPYTTIDGWYKKGYAGIKLSTLKTLSGYFGTPLDYWVQEGAPKAGALPAGGFVADAREIGHLQKYRLLDPLGKQAVDGVLNAEYQRYEEAKAAKESARRARQGQAGEGKVIPFRCSLQSASAGEGTYLGPEAFETLYVQLNPLTLRASFGVPVRGDSMEPRYHDGDILILDGAEELKVGETGVFSVDGEGYVKQLGNGELLPLNPAYDAIPLVGSIRCHGRVIGVLDPSWIRGR